ncbi:MAG TPA: hypothetical protein VGS58_05610 [Candidatus Sulfopaludibacter sp.]|nr:hypothetical protein [Candidatus Sulfopaludibacter sp.]
MNKIVAGLIFGIIPGALDGAGSAVHTDRHYGSRGDRAHREKEGYEEVYESQEGQAGDG